MMKVLVGKFILGVALLALGFLTGWYSRGDGHSNGYRASTELSLSTPDGVLLGTFPKGTVFVSELAGDRDADLGWWAYLPVYFGTSDEARTLLDQAEFNERHVISEQGVVNAHKTVSGQ